MAIVRKVSMFQSFKVSKTLKRWNLETLKPDLAMQTDEEVNWLTSP
jgi:hypothetical protein